MFKVISRFADLQDKNHVYEAGDVFPREGMEVTEERLAELSGCHNKQHKPLIVNVEEPKEEPKKPRKRTKKADE